MFYIFLFYFFFFALLYILSLYDLKSKLLPWKILLILFILSAVYSIFYPHNILYAFIITAPFILLYYFAHSIGGGDIKVIFCLSLVMGYPYSIYSLVFAFILSGVFSLLLLIFKRGNIKSTIPLVPFITIGIALSIITC